MILIYELQSTPSLPKNTVKNFISLSDATAQANQDHNKTSKMISEVASAEAVFANNDGG